MGNKRGKRERVATVVGSDANVKPQEELMTVPKEAATAIRGSSQIDNDGWPTTRCYPRTLLEAFPQDNTEWFYPPEQRMRDKVMFWVGIAIWVAVIVGVMR